MSATLGRPLYLNQWIVKLSEPVYSESLRGQYQKDQNSNFFQFFLMFFFLGIPDTPSAATSAKCRFPQGLEERVESEKRLLLNLMILILMANHHFPIDSLFLYIYIDISFAYIYIHTDIYIYII